MKKASFFIVLGLAVLLLFGCAGGGGPLGEYLRNQKVLGR